MSESSKITHAFSKIRKDKLKGDEALACIRACLNELAQRGNCLDVRGRQTSEEVPVLAPGLKQIIDYRAKS